MSSYTSEEDDQMFNKMEGRQRRLANIRRSITVDQKVLQKIHNEQQKRQYGMLNMTGVFTNHYIKKHNRTIKALKQSLEKNDKRVQKYYSDQKQNKYGNLALMKQNVITLQQIKSQNDKLDDGDYEYESKEDIQQLKNMFIQSKMQLSNIEYLIQRSTEAKDQVQVEREGRLFNFYDRRVNLMEKYFERNHIEPLSRTKQFIENVKERQQEMQEKKVKKISKLLIEHNVQNLKNKDMDTNVITQMNVNKFRMKMMNKKNNGNQQKLSNSLLQKTSDRSNQQYLSALHMSNNFSDQNEQDDNFIDKYCELVSDIQDNKHRIQRLKRRCDGNIDNLKVYDNLVKKVEKLKIY